MTRHLLGFTKSCVNQASYDHVYMREGAYRDGPQCATRDREEAETGVVDVTLHSGPVAVHCGFGALDHCLFRITGYSRR